MRCKSARPNSEAIISVSPEMRMADGWAEGGAREAGDEAAGLAGGCMRRGVRIMRSSQSTPWSTRTFPCSGQSGVICQLASTRSDRRVRAQRARSLAPCAVSAAEALRCGHPWRSWSSSCSWRRPLHAFKTPYACHLKRPDCASDLPPFCAGRRGRRSSQRRGAHHRPHKQ